MSCEIGPGIWMFSPPTGGVMYVVRTAAGLVLVDSGFFHLRDFFLDRMRENGLDPREIRLGFVTHFHCDHVGGMGWWQQQFGFDVVAHENAVQPLATADTVVTGASMPYIGFEAEFVPCPVAKRVNKRRSFTIGSRVFLAYAAPGHTVGSIHIATDRFLFVGDNLFADGTIGWIDVHWGSHPEDYVTTLERLRGYVGWTILPAHGNKPFVLEDGHIDHAKSIASFYIPTGHGLGSPRGPSQYTGEVFPPSSGGMGTTAPPCGKG